VVDLFADCVLDERPMHIAFRWAKQARSMFAPEVFKGSVTDSSIAKNLELIILKVEHSKIWVFEKRGVTVVGHLDRHPVWLDARGQLTDKHNRDSVSSTPYPNPELVHITGLAAHFLDLVVNEISSRRRVHCLLGGHIRPFPSARAEKLPNGDQAIRQRIMKRVCV
jgi:hypothetical protein